MVEMAVGEEDVRVNRRQLQQMLVQLAQAVPASKIRR